MISSFFCPFSQTKNHDQKKDRQIACMCAPSCLPACVPPADPLGRCGAVLMFRHQLAVLPAVDSELLALGIAGEAEGQQDGGQGGQGGAGGAAAVGNSYVDNLGKAGIKEVGPWGRVG